MMEIMLTAHYVL